MLAALRDAGHRMIELPASGPVQEWAVGWGLSVLLPAPGAERRKQQYEIARALLVLWGGRSAESGTLWEADHAVPLVEGGSLELANLRCLCLACHRTETRKLRARMASRKRAQ